MTRETTYNEVFDAQRHFRVLLDCMSHPGRIAHLASPEISPPANVYRATAFTGFALLNADVTLFTSLGANADAYLQANTNARLSPAEEADFLFLLGTDSATDLLQAKIGLPAYPDRNATAVIQVGRVGRSSAIGGVELALEGPGIESRETVCITDLNSGLIDILRQKNAEFPLGVDAIFVSREDNILCLPRTTRVTWNRL